MLLLCAKPQWVQCRCFVLNPSRVQCHSFVLNPSRVQSHSFVLNPSRVQCHSFVLNPSRVQCHSFVLNPSRVQCHSFVLNPSGEPQLRTSVRCSIPPPPAHTLSHTHTPQPSALSLFPALCSGSGPLLLCGVFPPGNLQVS